MNEKKYSKSIFPFVAICGQDTLKKALILNVINPAIGGVLISGEKGTAKSTLVRGLASVLEDMDVVNLPLNITEDRLIGTIDIEKAIKEGKREFDSGLLKEAHGNILYVDEVNLLSDSIVNCLLTVSAFRENRVEREGISCVHPSEFVLVGTMNPEEGVLRSQFIERFGLYVETKGSQDLKERMEIIKRRLEFEADECGYLGKWQSETHEMCRRIRRAKDHLSQVQVSELALTKIAEIINLHYCAGNRAEIVLTETAKALAAYELRTEVLPEDLKEAAELALPHRMRNMPEYKSELQKDEEDSEEQNDNKSEDDTENQRHDESQQSGNPPESKNEDFENEQSEKQENAQNKDGNNQSDSQKSPQDDNLQETIDEPDGAYAIKDLNIQIQDRKKREGSGRRAKTVANSSRGRYIRYAIPKGKSKDLAFDATLRVAAPFQKNRKKEDRGFTVHKSDFRDKVREMRTGSTILFVVDASGSMGAKQRMKSVKAAVLSLLNDAYQKRDKVGLVTFRRESAELLLGITRSVDLAQKCLKQLPTGGKTPLSSGLLKGYEILKAAQIKDPHTVPYLVVISDGRTNVSAKGGNPVEEAMEIGAKIGAEGIRSLVIDTENDFIKLELAAQLAEHMKADYCKLENLKEGEIETIVRRMA